MSALLDSGSQANYISGRAMLRAGLKPQSKEIPYPLHVANGEEMPQGSRITHEVTTRINIQGDQRKQTLDVFGLAAHDIILGLPWLRENNPVIDWATRTLSWRNRNDTTNSKPTHRQRSMVDEKKYNNNITSHKTHSKTRMVDLDNRGRHSDMSRVLEKRVTPDIPDQYIEFKKLFQEELGLAALLKH